MCGRVQFVIGLDRFDTGVGPALARHHTKANNVDALVIASDGVLLRVRAGDVGVDSFELGRLHEHSSRPSVSLIRSALKCQ